ncbi:hypothetical protein EDC01DRAFT_791761 [Geopyxis carbonaria]|nr:hypothetical protein EDC01DRAFT_791761 [Geopyxis carbonaria]
MCTFLRMCRWTVAHLQRLPTLRMTSKWTAAQRLFLFLFRSIGRLIWRTRTSLLPRSQYVRRPTPFDNVPWNRTTPFDNTPWLAREVVTAVAQGSRWQSRLSSSHSRSSSSFRFRHSHFQTQHRTTRPWRPRQCLHGHVEPATLR